MKIATFAFGGAVALASLLGTTSAFAFTHHPATPEEIQQTDALNAQALANAQLGTGTGARTTAGTGTTTDVQTPSPTTPPDANMTATTDGSVNGNAATPTAPSVPAAPNAPAPTPAMPTPNGQ
ncbi:MAG TPA: hypothetical protein VNU97_14315 [Rhizomicrobium sp.]|nr:hypothetical protein [Rhizomicrobium sp.]